MNESSTIQRLIEHKLLPNVRVPGRYIGGEVNQIVKLSDDITLRLALCFPDIYEIGMSNTALGILYDIVNKTQWAAAQRVFAPWTDAEEIMRAASIPLFSLETKSSVADFDVIGFSITTELCHTNILNMLDLAGLEVRTQNRKEEDPIVIAGGQIANCCEPLADFIDIFVIGEAEEAIIELLTELNNAKLKGLSRNETMLGVAKKFQWAYVPSLYEFEYSGEKIATFKPIDPSLPLRFENAVVRDFENAPVPDAPIVPFTEAVHERVSVEIMRGCPGRCRFCQSSFSRRPLRYRSVEKIFDIAVKQYLATGFDTISLLSLSTADHPWLEELLVKLNQYFAPKKVGISLPSLKIDKQLELLPKMVTSVRKGGLTIAVEAASEQLREMINKPISDENLFNAITEAYKAGFSRVKLYFMVGFPGETEQDIRAIVDLAYKVASLYKEINGRNAQVVAAVSWLVPKPHTPFQWLGQKDAQYFAEAKNIMLQRKRELGIRCVQIKFHELERSILEAAIGRGDRRCCDVVEDVWREGGKFDLWDEHFDYDLWQRKFADRGLNLADLAAASYQKDDILPWQHLGGLDSDYLSRHYDEACAALMLEQRQKLKMIQQIRENLKRYWGYTQFRPQQREAMEAACSGCDSVVVLPTGGGKSLCYQVPAMVIDGITLVISPLISLMKDQVDGLVQNGVPAARLDSSIDYQSQQLILSALQAGKIKILYLSPERLLSNGFAEFLSSLNVRFIAIDEAHCVSMWGHDFRPEYRRLSVLRELFGSRVTIGAYTATATDLVREDIAAQLALREPQMLVGSFDRPNLIYRVKRRGELLGQLRKIIDSHKGESGIIYCIKRDDVEKISNQLSSLGYKAMAYHAGLSDQMRKDSQDAFITENTDIIVATIAFGMGIDKSNVRYVIHSGMPKSPENYQQESGRAGRDGLEAECHLIWSGADYGLWKRIITSNQDAATEISLNKLNQMYSYCNSTLCRHKELLRYFGQDAQYDSCSACNVCLDELELVADSKTLAQKIISCVLRLEQRYGAEYTALVLTGSQDARILACQHDKLSTYGLLKDHRKQSVRNWLDQLISQGYLCKYGEYNTLGVTAKGLEVLKGDEAPRLLKPAAPTKARSAKVSTESWKGVDRGLFEKLRRWRSEIAVSLSLPAYAILTDVALRSIAKFKPQDEQSLSRIKGIGEKKLQSYGQFIIDIVAAHGGDAEAMDNFAHQVKKPQRSNSAKKEAFEMFANGASIEEVATATLRAMSTVYNYLAQYIEKERIKEPFAWIEKSDFKRIKAAAGDIQSDKLSPIYKHLEGEISYPTIKIALACIANDK